MHSSSAACVFGDARFTSSTSRRFAKTGPGRNSNSFERWSKTLTPVTSEGSRSGVNCSRENAAVERARERLREHRLPDAREVLDDQVALGDEAEDDEPKRLVGRVHDPREVRRDRRDEIGRRAVGGRGRCALSQGATPPRRGSPRRSRPSAPSRPAARRRCADERHLVVAGVEADVAARHVVEDDQVDALVRAASRARGLETALAAGRRRSRRAPGRGRARAPSSASTSVVGSSSTVQAARSLGRFVVKRLCGPVVGDGGRHDHDVGARAAGERLALEVARRSASRRARRRPGRRRRGSRRAASRARRAREPRRRARRPSGRRSGCRRSGPIDRLARAAG